MTQIERTSAVPFGSNGGGEVSRAGFGREPSRPQPIGPLWSAVLLSPSQRRSPIVCDSDHLRRHAVLVDAENSISGVWGAALRHMWIAPRIIVGWAADTSRVQNQRAS